MSRAKRRGSAPHGRTRARAGGAHGPDNQWSRAAWVVLPAVLVALGGVLFWTLRAEDDRASQAGLGPVHIHGLGINPADAALFIATHTGLFRVAPDDRKAVRVGESSQDTMGFTIVGPNRFLGSGHPDLRQQLPPLLGLIESTDGGATWSPVSLLGDADFHVLRSAHGHVYGYDVTNDRLLMSRNQGRSWTELPYPGPLVDLVVDPRDARHLLAIAEGPLGPGLFESDTGGKEWRQVASLAGLLAWPAPDGLYLVAPGGEVFASPDGGRRLELRGRVGGEPAAFAAHDGDLYVALHDGTIEQSADGGRTWTVRSRA